jgi:hypothetical protein
LSENLLGTDYLGDISNLNIFLWQTRLQALNNTQPEAGDVTSANECILPKSAVFNLIKSSLIGDFDPTL